MEITGYGTLRFKKVGDKLLWNTSIKIDAKSGKTYISIPTTLQKDVEEKVKKEFKARKISGEDKYLSIEIKKGFLSGYIDKDNKTVLKLVITDISFPVYKDKKNVVDDLLD